MPVNPQLLRDQAYRLVLEMIFRGEITANEPLSERKMAERLSMGRTPVREALKALARDGVVETRLARGTFVRGISHDDFRQLYEVRQALEGMAALLAAKAGPTRKMMALGVQMRHMRDCPDDYSGVDIDDIGTDFHREVFVAANNPMLRQVFEPLRLRFQLAFGFPRHHDKASMRKSLDEHLGVLEAIERQDGAASQQAMLCHLQNGLEVRARLFEALGGVAPVTTEAGGN